MVKIMNDSPIRMLVIALAVLSLGACTTYNEGNILPDKRVEYKKSRQAENALEVPPDLSQDTIAQGGVLPNIHNVLLGITLFFNHVNNSAYVTRIVFSTIRE